MAHRLLSTVGLGGFGIRFTVQFNLFAGSIVGLAGPEQVKMLDEIQDKGQLGCFLLTEMQAGVLSGLIVETTCDWDEDSQQFILHTPSDKAAKNWISQGYTAELGVVIADLRIKGKSHGPHPFFINLRDGEEGELLPGIRIDDMGTKTVANDLDNARVWFDKVKVCVCVCVCIYYIHIFLCVYAIAYVKFKFKFKFNKIIICQLTPPPPSFPSPPSSTNSPTSATPTSTSKQRTKKCASK